MGEKIVISGVGVISSIGLNKEDFWNNLIKGNSGISKVTLFDTSKFKRRYAGEIRNFDPTPFIPKEITQFLGRASQFAIAATKLALEDAHLNLNECRNKRLAIIVGTTMTEASVLDFSSEMLLKEEWDEITLKLLLNAFSPSIPRNIGCFLQLRGYNLLIPNACAAGNYAIGYGLDLIRKGKVDLAIVGGAEALSRVAFQGFQRLYAMAPRVCSPFDKNRKGMLLGEGAGILILEPFREAKKRKVNVYAEVLGYGLSCDAYHMTIPKKEGIKKAMEKAIREAGCSPENIDYICAHGTGTVQNDKTEAEAIKELFGENCRDVPVSSLKSMIGHCMGAASSIEAVACCLAIERGVIPPTINFKTPDPECDIDCVPNKARKKKLNIVLNNGFAFGGSNCCVIFSKPN